MIFVTEKRPPRTPPTQSIGRRGGALASAGVVLALKGLFWAIALTLPLLGAWFLSSLAAYANGPVWLAFIALFALFPLLPGAWEALGVYLRSRKKAPPPRILTFGDRLLLRTLALNILFLGGLLLSSPETGVRAVLARGDWMLDGATSPTAEKARGVFFAVADRFEWVYRASRERARRAEEEGKRKSKQPEPLPQDDGIDVDGKPSDQTPSKTTRDAPALRFPLGEGNSWPYPDSLHPIVVGLEPDSVAALGEAIKNGETEPFARAKAVHDWVADRIRYDVAALTGNRPRQDAETVFRSRSAVCEGYSRLFQAVATAAGLEAVYVGGVAKGANGEVDGRGHAWNAVKLGGNWYLVDATWDSGSVGEDGFKKGYKTDYLFTPPEIFRATHLADEEKWQIAAPINRGEFMRQPQLGPAFYKRGMKLSSPERSQTSVGKTGTIVVDNPSGQFMMATYAPKTGGASTSCEVTGTTTLTATCDFAGDGEYRVLLFGAAEKYTTYRSMGELQFLSKQ
jgi:transglutaminase-like putative cysteine protease